MISPLPLKPSVKQDCLRQDHPRMRAFRYVWSLSVTWQDGSHTIRSAVTKNPMLHANSMAPCFTEMTLFQIEVLHCQNRDFGPFLLLWPWPWPDDLHIRTWPVFPRDILDVRKWTSYVKAFDSYHLTDIQTYRHNWNYIPRCFAAGQQTIN